MEVSIIYTRTSDRSNSILSLNKYKMTQLKNRSHLLSLRFSGRWKIGALALKSCVISTFCSLFSYEQSILHQLSCSQHHTLRLFAAKQLTKLPLDICSSSFPGPISYRRTIKSGRQYWPEAQASTPLKQWHSSNLPLVSTTRFLWLGLSPELF